MVNYLHRVQILRFAAAAMVLVGHAQIHVRKTAGLDLSTYGPLGGAAFYASGVDIFFVISGFIMYVISREDFGRPGARTDFFLRRLARIGPPYWFFTTAMVSAILLLPNQVSHSQLSGANVLASYLFIPMQNAYGELYPVLVLGWTLNFEMLFYVVFAIGLRWSQTWGLAFVFLVVGVLGLVGVQYAPSWGPFAFWCNPVVFEFLLGILLARIFVTGWRCTGVVGFAVLVIGIVLLYFGSARSEPSVFWPQRVIWMGLPAFVICASAVLTRQPKAVGRISNALALGGDASYVLYLSHPFTLTLFGLLSRHLGIQDPWVFVVVACVLCIAVSLMLHRLFEKPAIAALNARIKRARPRVSSAFALKGSAPEERS